MAVRRRLSYQSRQRGFRIDARMDLSVGCANLKPDDHSCLDDGVVLLASRLVTANYSNRTHECTNQFH